MFKTNRTTVTNKQQQKSTTGDNKTQHIKTNRTTVRNKTTTE